MINSNEKHTLKDYISDDVNEILDYIHEKADHKGYENAEFMAEEKYGKSNVATALAWSRRSSVRILRVDTGGEYDYYTELVVMQIELPHSPYITLLKQAIRKIRDTFEDNVFIDRPRSQHDCTGQPFTTKSKLIYKNVTNKLVTYVYEHCVSIDC